VISFCHTHNSLLIDLHHEDIQADVNIQAREEERNKGGERIGWLYSSRMKMSFGWSRNILITVCLSSFCIEKTPRNYLS